MRPHPSHSRWLSLWLLISLAAVGTPAAQEPEKPAAWNVADPGGPFESLQYTVEEGTWMTLDVSPDGTTIVFDLLGDIYTMPVAGGAATRILGGVPWEMQPRFSPDGEWIAFTSDRAGGDNIWIARADGSEPQQVSKESFRLLNSPNWSPDGQYLVARKHFTSGRSLGAGEMWMYHRAGGPGIRLTERRNQQQDAGEPVFSPDGRYLYYSEDLTPGPFFQYNKDPNAGIYTIRRLDMDSGELESMIRRPGGAARPTPSPDGRTIAFVRRVRYQTTLFLHDVESGREWPIYSGLDRDMQETWAIHGVYPAFAWTPDGGSIVIWAGGRIHRIDLESGADTVIPFEADVEIRVAEAVRYPQQVAPTQVPLKMLRWVTVDPSGSRVAYSAIGRIFIKDLEEGTVLPVTGEATFAYYPAWNATGDHIVYVAWDDEELAQIRILDLGSGEETTVPTGKGHFTEPVFAPDGTSIVYRKVRGGGLVSPLWSRDPGVYVTPIDGSVAPERISRSGVRPQFTAAGDRLYLFDSEGEHRALVSVALDGSERRVHVTSDNATDIVVSPDGRWIAYSERFNAYVAPLPRAGVPIHVSSNAEGAPIPVTRVSRDAGNYLHWSGDSTTLHWSLGPELFTREVNQAFSFLEGAPDELPAPPEAGVNIAASVLHEVPAGAVALVDARIVTMNGDEVIEDGTIVVEGNRIAQIGSRGSVRAPAGAHVVDAAGMTIIPGLIDVHAHGGAASNGMVPQQSWASLAVLSFGVTTVHDPSNDTATIFTASEMAKAGRIVAPRIFSTGTILYGAAGDFRAEIDSLEDARSHLRRLKAVGAFSVKSYNQPRRDQRQQVIQAARELQMMVVPEGGSLYQHNMSMIADGHTGIEHSVPVARMYDDALTFWASSGTYYTPTLVVSYGGLSGENYWYQMDNVWENERLLSFVPRDIVEPRSRRRVKVPDNEFNHIDIARGAADLVNRGGSVQIGAHGQLQGLAAHWETWMLEQGGMTAHQALRSATLSGAEYLGLDADIGSLQVGKLADLVVLAGNPLEDLRATESARLVMVNGRLFDAVTMDEIGNHPRPRARLYWEQE